MGKSGGGLTLSSTFVRGGGLGGVAEGHHNPTKARGGGQQPPSLTRPIPLPALITIR